MFSLFIAYQLVKKYKKIGPNPFNIVTSSTQGVQKINSKYPRIFVTFFKNTLYSSPIPKNINVIMYPSKKAVTVL